MVFYKQHSLFLKAKHTYLIGQQQQVILYDSQPRQMEHMVADLNIQRELTKDDRWRTRTTITVAASAPTLYYYCQYHSGMGGQLNTT